MGEREKGGICARCDLRDCADVVRQGGVLLGGGDLGFGGELVQNIGL